MGSTEKGGAICNKLHKYKSIGPYVTFLEYKSIGTYWIAFYMDGDNVTYFDSFGVNNIPRQNNKFIGNKNIINIYRTHAHDLIMCRYVCIGFINFVLSINGPGNIGTRYHPKRDKFSMLFLGWNIIRKFETLR